jgi:hypothetical protein
MLRKLKENATRFVKTGLLICVLVCFIQLRKGELVERQIRNPNTGLTDTFKIPAGVAMQLDHLQSIGDDDSYDKLARRFTEGRSRAAVSGDAGAKVSGAAPSVSAGRPGVAQAPTGGPKSETQKKEEAVRREKRAEEETKIDVEAEAALGANSKSAREMFSAAQRLQKAAELSPNVFGLLQAPTVGSALLTIIRDGIQAGNTSIRIGGFEKALILSYPGVEKEDIKNLEIAYSALAEIELKYTQLYLKGQGQVTEGERLIVRKLGGTPENSPEFLKGQAKLIQMRAQYDIDVIDTFQRLKDQNPNITWTQFQRSPAYRGLENDYNKKLAKEFDLEPAIPTNKRDSSGTKFPEVKRLSEKTSATSEPTMKLNDRQTQYANMVVEEARRQGVNPQLALSVAFAENSPFNPNAVSPKGAIGIMQLIPSKAEELGVDPYDVTQNIEGGIRLLKNLNTKFEGDSLKVVVAYNAGENKDFFKTGDLDNLKDETLEYVTKIAGYNNGQIPSVLMDKASETASPNEVVTQEQVTTQEPPSKPSLFSAGSISPDAKFAADAERHTGRVAGGVPGLVAGATLQAAGALGNRFRGAPSAAPTAPAAPTAAPTTPQARPGPVRPPLGGTGTQNYARAFGLGDIEAGRAADMTKQAGGVHDLTTKRAAGLQKINELFPNQFREDPRFGGLMTPQERPGPGPRGPAGRVGGGKSPP